MEENDLRTFHSRKKKKDVENVHWIIQFCPGEKFRFIFCFQIVGFLDRLFIKIFQSIFYYKFNFCIWKKILQFFPEEHLKLHFFQPVIMKFSVFFIHVEIYRKEKKRISPKNTFLMGTAEIWFNFHVNRNVKCCFSVQMSVQIYCQIRRH